MAKYCQDVEKKEKEKKKKKKKNSDLNLATKRSLMI